MITAMRTRMRLRHEADGFTLIELVVALAIATVIFSAMAAAGLAGVKASVVARQNQQSVDVLNRLVEEIRAAGYASVAMVESDLQVNDDAISPGLDPQFDVPNGIGAEDIWLDDTGSVNPHVVTTTTADNIEYTTRTYVTVPSDFTLDTAGQPDQKRITILITWDAYGQERERVISTLLTETTRGLPLPRYAVIPVGETLRTQNPDTQLVWGFQVINRGAPDTFNVSSSPAEWSWDYYKDTNCDGAVGTDEAPLPNTDIALGDTRPDTGMLEPNNYPPFCIVAVREIDPSETKSSVTFIFESSAQPDVDGADVAVGPFEVTVTTGSTGGGGTPSTICEPTSALGAGTPFGFRNGTARVFGDTPSQLVSTMEENSCPNQPTAANYSTEAGSGTGRSLTTGGLVTTAPGSQLAEWRWQPGVPTTVAAGTATISVMVLCPVTGSVTLNGAIGTWEGTGQGTWDPKGTGSTGGLCVSANTWTRVNVPMSVIASFPVTIKDKQTKALDLSVRLWTTGAANQQIRINYEQADAKSFLYVSVN